MDKIIVDKIIDVLNSNIDDVVFTYEDYDLDLSLLGLDSIAFIHSIVALEEIFNIEIPDEYLIPSKLNTISKFEDVLSTLITIEHNYTGD